jgi:patatin-like phospholipase/acyl hydrolase
VVFDSESPEDSDKTILAVGRATSAAPTFFEGSRMQDNKIYYDGACYANNPSAWGLVLATTKVKLDSVMLISVGTGYADLQPIVEEPKDEGYFASAMNMLGDFWESSKKYLKEAVRLADNG